MPTLFSFTPQEILETIRMVQVENLDIRTITLGISLRDCATGSLAETCRRVYDKINRLADKLVPTGEEVAAQYGIPIVNKRIAVTPIAQVGEPSGEDNFTPLARALDGRQQRWASISSAASAPWYIKASPKATAPFLTPCRKPWPPQSASVPRLMWPRLKLG